MRLHELSEDQLKEWTEARMESGRKKYHHIDHKRNSMVDIVEEAMDILNIMSRFSMHQRINPATKAELLDPCWELIDASKRIIEIAMHINHHLGDIDDSCGGHRVWWSEQEEEEKRPDICEACKNTDICDLLRSFDGDETCLRLKKETLLKSALSSLKKYFELEEMLRG